MKAFTVQTYRAQDAAIWNEMVRQAKNGLFLFLREFMDYHQDCFDDHSLMFYRENKLIAVLPANRKDDELVSHGGLTYGGLIYSNSIKLKTLIRIFEALFSHMNEKGFQSLVYKPVPDFYCTTHSQEVSFLLPHLKAEIIASQASAVLDIQQPAAYQTNRREGVRKARRMGLQLREEDDFESFWNAILIPVLQERHGTAPTHTLEEIERLNEVMTEQIRQFNVYQNEKIIAGATVFESTQVAHVQYIAAHDGKQESGALDFLFDYLIHMRYADLRYIDFGTSSASPTGAVNEGLLYWKESFGARVWPQLTYRIQASAAQGLKELLQ
ncbi:GNAT family N-acetyltransferase [Croceiramulus getboli]|nr:GNAT family N-acetyltransferase [Flavobacteriaceae bacterium YJPT1-3]